MDQERIREISAEMCELLEQQTGLITKRPLDKISPDEVDGYAQRYARLRQLAKELEELA